MFSTDPPARVVSAPTFKIRQFSHDEAPERDPRQVAGGFVVHRHPGRESRAAAHTPRTRAHDERLLPTAGPRRPSPPSHSKVRPGNGTRPGAARLHGAESGRWTTTRCQRRLQRRRATHDRRTLNGGGAPAPTPRGADRTPAPLTPPAEGAHVIAADMPQCSTCGSAYPSALAAALCCDVEFDRDR